MDGLAGDRHRFERRAAALNREPHARPRVAAQRLSDALLHDLERRRAFEHLRDLLTVDRADHVLGLESRFVGRAVEDDVLDVQEVRLLVDAVGDPDAAERRPVEPLVERRVLLGRQEYRIPVLDRAEHSGDRRVGDLRRARQRFDRFELGCVVGHGAGDFAVERFGVGGVVLARVQRRQRGVRDLVLLEIVDDRGTRAVERSLPINLLVEIGGQPNVARDELFGLHRAERGCGRGCGGHPGCGQGEQCGQGDGDEAFHQTSFLLSMIFFAALSCLSAGVSMIGRSTRWATMTSGMIPL